MDQHCDTYMYVYKPKHGQTKHWLLLEQHGQTKHWLLLEHLAFITELYKYIEVCDRVAILLSPFLLRTDVDNWHP